MTDYLARVPLPDGREICVYPLTYGRARLGIGPAGGDWFTDEW